MEVNMNIKDKHVLHFVFGLATSITLHDNEENYYIFAVATTDQCSSNLQTPPFKEGTKIGHS